MKKILLFGLLLSAIAGNAQDRLFTYTYQSNVLNKGQKEIEVFTTLRNGREHYFRGIDHRFEFEVGLGSKLQTAFYLNYGYSKGIVSADNIESVSVGNSYSFSNEWKLKLSDPVANAIGSALYGEVTLGTDELELEGKLLLDKQLGKTVHALNLVGEYEIENEFEVEGNEIEVEKEAEVKIKFNYGFAYQLNKNFSLGFEMQNKNSFEEAEWEHSVLTAGPCLSYNMNGFWLNLTCMPQVTDFKSGKLQLTSNEKIQTRLIFAYVF